MLSVRLTESDHVAATGRLPARVEQGARCVPLAVVCCRRGALPRRLGPVVLSHIQASHQHHVDLLGAEHALVHRGTAAESGPARRLGGAGRARWVPSLPRDRGTWNFDSRSNLATLGLRRRRSDGHSFAGSSEDAEDLRGLLAGDRGTSTAATSSIRPVHWPQALLVDRSTAAPIVCGMDNAAILVGRRGLRRRISSRSAVGVSTSPPPHAVAGRGVAQPLKTCCRGTCSSALGCRAA